MKLINADDFGYSEADSVVINQLINNNIIQTTTIMVNAPYFYNSLKIIDFDKNKVGLHLCLTEFKPLSDSIKNNKKFVINGHFYNNPNLRGIKGFFYLSKKDKNDLQKEIESQMLLFRKYFPTSNFLDSHHHIHTCFGILQIVVKLAKKYNFKRLRISKNIDSSNFLKNIYKTLINTYIRSNFPYSFKYFADSSNNSLKICYNLKDNIEIMVHPFKDECGVIKDKLTGTNINEINF
ncbi:MAG: ChbG/HpnK family deacetylase [Bacilli bacterium]|nr:ChbG/HpnK family deacetylase [Bacilli bacterium]